MSQLFLACMCPRARLMAASGRLPPLLDLLAPHHLQRCRALLAGNDGKQKIRGVAPPGVNHVGTGVVVRAVVRVGKAADAVARLDVEPDAMRSEEHTSEL